MAVPRIKEDLTTPILICYIPPLRFKTGVKTISTVPYTIFCRDTTH
jgi:hypothetical protein